MKRLLAVSVFFFALSSAQEAVDSFVVSDSTSTDSALSKSQVQYISLPANVTPLNDLLPQGGVAAGSGALMRAPRSINYSHDIDFESRDLEIKKNYVNPLSRDTTELWEATYPELATYVMDMYDIGFNRLWLNSFAGQKGGYSEPENGSLFDISIPVNMPAWMKDFGFDKPKLLLQGTMDIRLSGRGELDDAPGSTKDNLFPSPTLNYDPSFMVKGKIGPYITVEVNNVESGLGIKNQLRVVYEESYKDEFEDYILQRVEAGSTSLNLAGTEFTGYSENHKGLFGIKAEWKLGDWRLTTIASQDGGSQETYTINASSSTTEFQIQDKQFLAYRYYFLNQEARSNYISAGIAGRTTSSYSATNLKLYKRASTNTTSGVVEKITAVYITPDGGTIEKTIDRMMEMSSSDYSYDSRTGIVKVTGASRNTLIAASWSGDGSGRTGTTINDGSRVVLIQWDATLSELTDIDKLMLRNVYSVGISDESSSGFILRLKNKSGVSSTYLKTLGVVDTSTGTVLTGDATIFKKDASGSYTGEMWLPCHPISWYTGSNAASLARENCLEPFRNVDSSSAMAKLYTLPVYNLSSKFTNRFYFESVGKRRNSVISVRDPNSSYSVSSGSCMDISEGSEKLKAGSEVLERGTDYDVNYELGQIELLSERALDPNKEITVSFECDPLFEIDSKVLLGARAELPLTHYGFGDGSLFGVTALYKSQTTTSSVPTLGNEPYSSFLWGMNLRLQDTTQWMSAAINKVPFIDTKAKSNWRFETEFASSYHNANTSDSKTALLEDFESSESGLTYPLSRLSWYQASPPGGVDTDPSTYIENQDYKHKGEFIWHSNNTELYKYIYPTVGNSDVDNQRLTVLKFTLRPNDNLAGNSWGGVMRPNSSYYQDLSDKKYIEVIARGNVGSLYLDLGLVSEDLSINGDAPNDKYDGENDLGTTTALHDKGLDGLSGSDETLEIWDCRISGCVSTIKNSANSDATNTDIARDNFDDDLDDDSDPPVTINGTENNSGERSYDTEDINKNGSLDKDISFVRYRIDLSSDDDTKYETLKNGWRKWKIPLDQFDTIVSTNGESYSTILAESQFSRLWFGKISNGVAEAKVQIVSLAVLGNSWEGSDVSSLYETSSNGNTQTAVVDGSSVDISSTRSSSADSTYLTVSTLNNRENSGTYFKSPNTATERDAETNAALKETALVLDYKNLSPGQVVGATRVFDSETKDLTKYKSLKMEIHYTTDATKVPVRFALQFGEGSLDGSTDYYEWSFKPVKITCSSSERTQDCHERNWLANAFSEKLSAFSDLKKGRSPPYLTPVVDSIGGDREEVLKLVGNPSTTSVDWIRFVIIADDDASPADLEGEFWVDDLRLSGMDTDWGYALRMSGQTNFSDVLSISGSAKYQDGNFATLSNTGSSPKPSLSEAKSQLDLAADASLNVNKFFKDEYGLHMPMSVGYSSTTERPYLKPTDDLQLSQDNLADFAGDIWNGKLVVSNDSTEQKLRDNAKSQGYQSFSRTRRFSFSYSKDYKSETNPVAEILSQVFLERPAWSYSYNETETRATTSADSTYSYHTIIEYNLGTYNRFNYKPFEKLKKQSWAKSFSDASFEPWPQTIDLTLFDLSYIRYVDQDRDPDYAEPQTDKVVTYTVDLSHKASVRWNIFPFLTTNYSLNITRDMYGGGDQEAFAKENFWSTDNGGLFAAGDIFDYDHTDRKVYVSPDSVIAIPYDTVAVVSSSGDTSVIDMDDASTYKILYDSTVYYRVDSVGKREYGRAYGILRNERSRSQQFKTTFNPNLISFLPMTFAFSSSFTQQKTIPDDFDLTDETTVEKNYWTISQTNRFEFSPSFQLITFSKLFGDNNVAASFLNKLKWREVKATWTTDLSTVGENFTLAQLYEQQGVTPFEYYLYGLGIGNGYKNRGLWNIVSGDMELDSRDDYTRFAEYRNGNVDTLVYQGNFTHSVDRTLNLSTGFTLPIWDIGVVADMQWKEDFSQSREYPLYTDSTIVWPKWGVGVTIPNFAQRVGFLNSFRSVSTTHRVDYTYTRVSKPFQSAEDSWTTTWNFNPLVRISFLTQKNIRIDDNTFLKLEFADRRPKQEVISQTNWPNSVANSSDTTEYFYTPWIPTSLYKDFGYNAGNDLTITYPLKTKRGFQLWKWYFKLQSDIDLRLTAGYEYTKTIREIYEPITGYKMWEEESGTDGVYKKWTFGDKPYTVYYPKLTKTERTVPSRVHEWYIRPSAGYEFNKMASMSAYIEYRQIREKLDDETAHVEQILSFEIALLLKFN
ncbi:MAG: cell surface protein SprA [Fibrobacteraceae bacterium]|nr:cell surface protein SprA [Fibrobacteraceae bacterium]